MTRSLFPKFLLAALLALPLATAGCSKGQSPTEPSLADLEATSESSSLGSASEESRGSGSGSGGGGDDSVDDNDNNRRRRGRGNGNDDANNDDRRGRGNGNDDANNDDRRGRRGRRNGNGNGNNDDNRPRAPRAGQEFEAAVTAVDPGAGSLTLAGGTRVVVNAQTQWIARGDLHSLGEIAGSLRSGQNPRVEGRGTRQADGSILAVTIKAEHDGD